MNRYFCILLIYMGHSGLYAMEHFIVTKFNSSYVSAPYEILGPRELTPDEKEDLVDAMNSLDQSFLYSYQYFTKKVGQRKGRRNPEIVYKELSPYEKYQQLKKLIKDEDFSGLHGALKALVKNNDYASVEYALMNGVSIENYSHIVCDAQTADMADLLLLSLRYDDREKMMEHVPINKELRAQRAQERRRWIDRYSQLSKPSERGRKPIDIGGMIEIMGAIHYKSPTPNPKKKVDYIKAMKVALDMTINGISITNT